MNKRFVLVSVLSAIFLAGCQAGGTRGNTPNVELSPPPPDGYTLRPVPRPSGGAFATPKPVETARTVEDFDTTTRAQRQEALADDPAASRETKLGTTIVSLGSPTEPGFWMKTPLVSKPMRGRLEYSASGKSVAVDLIPIDGPKTAGSRVSLAALRLLGASLAGLAEIRVFSTN